MSDLARVEGTLSGAGLRFGVVAARFNAQVVDRLLEGALGYLERHDVASGDLLVVRVPGAWEIPVALDALARAQVHDGLIALGAVIRGETPHFDFVCEGCMLGCERVQGTHGVPVGFGLLTCDDTAQALARAGGRAGNKGEEAAEASLRMVTLLRALRSEEASL